MKDRLTVRLLSAGIVAGPLVLACEFIHALLRPGFSLRRHASSQLALGDWGWLQSLNFIVAGLLMLAFALGLRRAVPSRLSSVWSAMAIAVFGACHVLVGCFSTDPAFGFPPGPGTPAGLPAHADASGHAMLHNLFGLVGFVALAIGCAILARHLGRQGDRAGAALAWLPPLTIIAITFYAASFEAGHADPALRAQSQFDFRPMWASLPLIWLPVSALAWRLRRLQGTR